MRLVQGYRPGKKEKVLINLVLGFHSNDIRDKCGHLNYKMHTCYSSVYLFGIFVKLMATLITYVLVCFHANLKFLRFTMDLRNVNRIIHLPMRPIPSSAPSWTQNELTARIPRTCFTSFSEKSLLNPHVFLIRSAI